MIALYRKELRALVPFALLCCMMSLDILERPFVERLDEQTWVGISDYVGGSESSWLGYLIWILAAIVAFAAFPREHDERTIEFLYSLPVRRAHIFAAKVAAGITVVWLGLVVLFVTDGVQSSLNPQSISGGQWRLDLALTLLAMQLALAAVGYAHALLASTFRLFGVIPYVLALFVLSLFDDAFPPLTWADPTSMLTVQYEGTSLVIPWGAIIGHGIVGVLVLALAYAAWMGPADRIGRALESVKESALSKGLMGCGAAMAAVFLALIAMGMIIGADEDDPEADDGALDVDERTTDRYVFTYPASQRARATALMDAADPVHEEIRRRLGAEVGPKIIADLTEVSSDHLGIASWTHVRVGIVAEPDPVRCRRTFAHETVHVFQHRLSDGRQGDEGGSTRFFSEGSAEHVAYLVVPSDAELARARALGAAAWTRHRMTMDDLFDDARLRARFDTALVYMLGELWTAALVEAYGEDAIGGALRALGRPDAPRDLGPRALWEDTLRAAGADLETVDAAFLRLIARTAESERAFIDALPRIGGAVARSDGWEMQIVAELDRDPQPGWKYYVRLRLGPDSDDTEAVGVEGYPEGVDRRRVVFRVPTLLVPGRRFQMIFSIQPDPEGWAWSETWQWASAPR